MSYVREKVNSKTEFIHVKPTDFHNIVQVKNMYLDVSKLTNLGFKPKYSIEQGLDKIIEHYQTKLGELT